MAQKSVAVLVRLTPETYKKFEQYRKELGMNKSAYASATITAGMQALMRSVHPENSFPPGFTDALVKATVKAAMPDVRKVLRNAKKSKR